MCSQLHRFDQTCEQKAAYERRRTILPTAARARCISPQFRDLKLAIHSHLLGPHPAFVVAARDTTAVDPKASVGVLAAVTLEAKVKSAPITTGGWADGVASDQVCACGYPSIVYRVPDGSVIAS